MTKIDQVCALFEQMEESELRESIHYALDCMIWPSPEIIECLLSWMKENEALEEFGAQIDVAINNHLRENG